MKTHKDIALVLSGGGARGLAHIGVIKALLQNGYNITSIAGTSMGAIVGGMYAAGGLEQFEDWITKLTKKDVFQLVDLTFWGSGFIKGDRVFDAISQLLPSINIEDLDIPFCAVATEIKKEKEVCINSGNLFDAIRASSSIPIAFLPQQREDGSLLVDGGVLNNVPIDYIERKENDLLVVSYVNAYKDKGGISDMKKKIKENKSLKDKIMPHLKHKNMGYIETMEKSIEMMMNKLSKLAIEKHQPEILIEVQKESFSFYEFYNAKTIIGHGEQLTQRILEKRE